MQGECVCNLAIPGVVPLEAPNTALHFEFLKFLNKLASHEMFESWKYKDPLYPIPDNTQDNYLAYDNTSDCLVAQTDGSFDNGVSGYGVYFKLDT